VGVEKDDPANTAKGEAGEGEVAAAGAPELAVYSHGPARRPLARRIRRAVGLSWDRYPAGKLPLPQAIGRRVLAKLADRYGLFIASSMSTPYKPITHRVFTRDTSLTMHLDYIRYATAELVCREIERQGLTGSIAEVGVYQAWWARVVNYHLPERTMYLFDTFEGFDERDLEAQERAGLPGEAPYVVGSLDPEEALAFLPHRDKAIVRKGWFPETAAGLEDETFCYVDVDTALYEPTLAGLRWFYPRLVPGGFLNVVDYNNAHTPGIMRAVDEFADEVGLGFVPVPDHGGCVTFVKPRR
jgi:O-methyltransferase